MVRYYKSETFDYNLWRVVNDVVLDFYTYKHGWINYTDDFDGDFGNFDGDIFTEVTEDEAFLEMA